MSVFCSSFYKKVLHPTEQAMCHRQNAACEVKIWQSMLTGAVNFTELTDSLTTHTVLLAETERRI